MAKGHIIPSGGTTVIGQDQHTMGDGFVGDVTELNVWDVELSESDISAQYQNCHITYGSVIEWPYSIISVHGGTEMMLPSC